MDAWLHHFGLLPHESVAGDLFEWARAWAWTADVECRGCAYCDDSGEESRGTKRGREEIEIEIVPDETGSLEADDGSQPTKRAKIDQMPSNAYEQERLERIRQNNEARRLPNFRLHWRLALSRTRPRYRCAARICCSSSTARRSAKAMPRCRLLRERVRPRSCPTGCPHDARAVCSRSRRDLHSLRTSTRMGRSSFARCACSRPPRAAPHLPLGRNCAACARLA